MATAVGTKIYLTLLNGTGYVFNADDYMHLRAKHRIVGSLVGSRNLRGGSINASTLPVELTTLETRLLVERGVAVLVSKHQALLHLPTSVEQQAYKEKFDARIAEQADALKLEKLRESERNIEAILMGKKKKMLREGVPSEDITLDANEVLQEIAENLTFDPKNALLEINCEHPEEHIAQIVTLPPDNSLGYRVFRDLWFRGKYVTCGNAFGADFLVYPGDPLLYHASHIVILLDEPVVGSLSFIGKMRLSVAVNKMCVFAYLDSAMELRYQTVKWEHNHENPVHDVKNFDL